MSCRCENIPGIYEHWEVRDALGHVVEHFVRPKDAYGYHYEHPGTTVHFVEG